MRKTIVSIFCALTLLAGGTVFFSKNARAQVFQSMEGCRYNCEGGSCTATTSNVGGETVASYRCTKSSATATSQFPVEGGSNNGGSAVSNVVNSITSSFGGSRSSNRSSGSGGGCESGFSEEAGVCVPSSTNLPSGSVDQIITNFMNWLLMIFSTIAVIAFLISGIQYLVSTGDENMMQTAKRNMIYSIVGVLVGLCGLVVLRAITALLSANSAI